MAIWTKQVIGTILSLFILTVVSGAENTVEQTEVATFAGGCFWCLQPPFDKTTGVISTVVGYAGGKEPSPTYEQVSLGETGHVEAIQVIYDPAKVNYQKLLEIFWHNVDPTDPNGQFCDKGPQYISVIFTHNEKQQKLAQVFKNQLLQTHHFNRIFTDIRSFTTFYPAEEYHQEYYKKNPVRYKFYRFTCGRDQKLKNLWENK